MILYSSIGVLSCIFYCYMLIYKYMNFGTFFHITDKNYKNWQKKIELLKTLKGLNCIEIWLETLDVAEQNLAELQKITAGFKKVIHAPFINLSLVSCHREINQASVSILGKAAEIGKLLGAELMTCHAGAYPVFYSESEAIEIFINSWGMLPSDKHFFALENISPQQKTTVSFPTSIISLKTIKQALPDLKVTLDIGHLIQASEPREAIEHFFTDYGKDIVNIHLHDAITGKNGHLSLGLGDLDLKWFFELLKENNYVGCVNLEMLNDEDAFSSWTKIMEFI